MDKAIHPEKHHLPLLKALWAEAFGDSENEIQNFFRTAFCPARCLCIPKSEQMAAAAYWLDCSDGQRKFAYLYAVATAGTYRRQGLCHSLLSQLHDLLTTRGYDGVILVPAEGLSPFYHAMGYRFFGGTETLSCQAATPTSLRSISSAEYALLRRQFLPEGGVIQEKEHLAYLETFAQFYRGEGFLLAACRKENQIQGELLGNTANAPAVVAALGGRQGLFRCPGRGELAMFRPLTTATAPGYFGLAFDELI